MRWATSLSGTGREGIDCAHRAHQRGRLWRARAVTTQHIQGEDSSWTISALKTDVEDELQWEPSINAAEIGVAVKEGIVTLTGRVPSLAQKSAAARAAARVTGVKVVVNELEVGPPPADRRTDEEIARSVANALDWNTSIPSDRIKAQVSQGWVTLEGTVDWYYQKEAAERAVRYLRGVKGGDQ